MPNAPSANGPNGRDSKGRFTRGNAFGQGNPLCTRVSAWRSCLARAVSDEDVIAVIQKLTEAAKRGEPWAVSMFLDRVLGKVDRYVLDDAEPSDIAVLMEHLRIIHESWGLGSLEQAEPASKQK